MHENNNNNNNNNMSVQNAKYTNASTIFGLQGSWENIRAKLLAPLECVTTNERKL